ncbi:kinesin light chain [Ceratobasidium sp. AG-Ba]|nr:kinesin light chain [Ceratobasidium sp. AG-Ba]
MPRRRTEDDGIAILVGDSSGASGLSTALLLHHLMKTIQEAEGLSKTPLVGDYFDIVAGAGTGAVIMTFAARLCMSTEKVIESLARLSREVYADENMIKGPAFSASKLERTLKNIVREETGNENQLMYDETASNETKTMVFAMSKHNMNASVPAVFRSYNPADNPAPNCPIWQALRASTAHPEMFESMGIEELGISQPYIDAAIGCSNPIEHVLAEAKRIYPNRRVACIVSIGGGHARTIQIPDSNVLSRMFSTNVIMAMRDIATDSESIAQTMDRRFQATPNVYFRLNVDQGVQTMKLGDWDRLGEVMAHTRAYISKVGTNELVQQASKSVRNRTGVIPMKYIDGAIQLDVAPQVSGIKECPVPTSVFTERHEPLRRAIDCLTDRTQDRRVFVYHGLGGAGKTQLALETVQRTKERWSDIVYVDATSTETIKSTLGGFATAKRLGDTYEDTLRWLRLCTTTWLMVFDNADDPSVGLRQYFPIGTGGRILITTRVREVVLYSQGPDSEYNVSSMEPDEALQLLLTVARAPEVSLSDNEKESAMLMIQDLGFMALALVQAGAYIWRTSCSFTQYREMYAAQPKQLLEKYSNAALELSGYEKTVYGTWVMSYQQLSQHAQNMLWLVAYLQRDRISVDIFRHAAARAKGFEFELPLVDLVPQKALESVRDYLNGFLIDDEWNAEAFVSVMEEIMLYSLISFDRINKTYVLHVLVQNWIQGVIPCSPDEALARSTVLLLISTDRKENSGSRIYRRSLELHIDKIIQNRTSASDHSARQFGYIMQEIGRYSDAERLQLQSLELYEELLEADDEKTLWLRSDLGWTFSCRGQYKQAETLQVQVLDARKRVLGDEHPDTLTAMSNLAVTYSNQGLHKQAETLQVQVLDARKRVLGDEHPDTLTAMSNLAVTYRNQGLHKQAETLQVQVLDARKRVLGDEHPETLTAMNHLAVTYSNQGLHKQAETLEVQVLDARKRVLGDEHPDTLIAMRNLAATYSNRGLWHEAESLEVQVVEVSKRVLGERHPDTLSVMRNLAKTYKHLGWSRRDEYRALKAQIKPQSSPKERKRDRFRKLLHL